MITNNPETKSLEDLAGVPNARELEQLANQLFPDLVDESNAASAAAIAPADEKQTAAQGHGYVPAQGYVPHYSGFDWEHPFAYGGNSTDNWLNAVEAVAAPQETAAPVSYSPKVLSKDDAAKNSRQIGSHFLEWGWRQ